MSSAPIFYHAVVNWTTIVLLAVVVVVEAVAFVHCATRRPAAFAAVGSVPKGGWVAMTLGALLFTLLLGYLNVLLGAVAVAVGLVYLLDVRPALRDAVDGRGNW